MSEFHGPTSSVAVFVEGLGCWHSGHTKAIEKALREVEEAHLLGTSDPYGTPKPPHEYKWGDKVEVNDFDGWGVALYVAPTTDHGEHWCSTKKRPYSMSAFKTSDIRPLEPSND